MLCRASARGGKCSAAADVAGHVNGVPFIDRSPLLFEHILDFLRSSVPPIFWIRTDGFDLSLYASLICEAKYFQLEALASWIRDERYISTISITSLIEVLTLSDSGHGKSHPDNIEQEFEPGTLSRPGKSTTLYKRLLLRKSRLRLPVSDLVLIFRCILTETCFCKKSSKCISAPGAVHGNSRTTRASFLKRLSRPVHWYPKKGKNGRIPICYPNEVSIWSRSGINNQRLDELYFSNILAK